MTLALKGLKIIDITQTTPGMYCTMMLADLGAEVIRVERLPEGGSQSEESSTRADFEEGSQFTYEALNRNKRSIYLNLKSEEARQIVHQLARNADVFLEGFRPGVAKRLGVDYPSLKEINSRLIYCSMSGYGQDGPYHQLPGHDINFIAVGGAMDMIGQRNGPPVIPMNFIADWAGASLHAAMGILTAVIARQRTGRGQYIDISYLDGVLSLMTLFAYDYLNNGTTYQRGETPIGGGWPGYNIYETKDDKYFTIGCLEPRFWENLCHVLGKEDFISYQFDTGEKRGEIEAYLKKTFRTRTREEWFDFLKDKDIPIGKVHSLDEVFSDPQVLHRQMLVEVEQPPRGKTRQVGIPIKLSDTPGRITGGSPRPGQHTEEVLTELGYTVERIVELDKEEVIRLSTK